VADKKAIFKQKKGTTMNSLTQFKKISILPLLVTLTLVIGRVPASHAADLSAQPVIDWSTEARRAIVPPSAGPENYGNKFPGEAAVYMGIVHAAIYDAAVAIEGGYEPYAVTIHAPPDTSSAAAIATATHDTLIGLQPPLGLTDAQLAILNGDYANYLATIPDGTAKTNGILVGQQVAAAIVALRTNDGREKNPTLADLNPPPPGPGIWERNPGSPLPPVLGLRLPGITPLALNSVSQFRPDGPNALTSTEYTEDFDQVKDLGRFDSTSRTPAQTIQALFWTDHDLRVWNDGMLRLVTDPALMFDLVKAARMLAMAHVSGGDAMIAGFEAKYHYWFWRPFTAIHEADIDGNPDTEPDPTWQPLRTTPNFPEYPAAHCFHSSALATALAAFFGTDRVPFYLDSRVTQTTREYVGFRDAVRDVELARTLAGFHFRNSCLQGANLGRTVGRYVANHYFQPVQ
jgi:hypothetical protein